MTFKYFKEDLSASLVVFLVAIPLCLGIAVASGADPLSGDVYLFVNSRCNRAKVLLWDGTGLCIYMKRLERGRFAAPWKRQDDGAIILSRAELSLFIEGSQLVFMGQLSPDPVEPRRVATKSLVVR